MGSPPRYGYSSGYRAPSPNQDQTTSRSKYFEQPASASISQDPIPRTSAYQLPRPTSMQPRYNATEPQRYLDTVPYPTNQHHPPPRVMAEHVRSPVFSSTFQSQGPMMNQRHLDGSGGGMYPPSTQSNTATSNMYESRPAYNMHSSHTGSSSSMGAPGQFSWGQSQNMPHLNVGGMSVDTQQASAAYQSSVSPVIPTGGMPFGRTGGPRNTHSVDDEFDGRTRNAKAQKRHREKRKAHVKHVSLGNIGKENSRKKAELSTPAISSKKLYWRCKITFGLLPVISHWMHRVGHISRHPTEDFHHQLNRKRFCHEILCLSRKISH
jgi:hypothetical protein